MAKTGRRSKDDQREPKEARISVNITKSQRSKLEWLVVYLRVSMADLLGSWIDNVFAGMGGDLNAKPEPMPKKSEPTYSSFHRLVMLNFDQLTKSDKFSNGRLQELMGGVEPTDLEIVRIALICGVSEEFVRTLPNKTEENGSNADIRVD